MYGIINLLHYRSTVMFRHLPTSEHIPPKAPMKPPEALHWKLQTSIHQIEFHNDTVFGYGKVEQVRLKVFPENSDQIGPAVWL
jgi:hypothetical protein